MANTETYIEVAGLRQFVKKLREVSVALPAQVRAANLEIVTELTAQVKANAPRGTAAERDPHIGKLAASVKGYATANTARISIGRKLLYAKPVIFGWPQHNIRANKFPYRVLEYDRASIIARYSDALARALAAGSDT